jgi:acyl-CoA synthetase (NDP forming)
MALPPLSSETLGKLSKIHPGWSPVRNPLDIWTAIEKVGATTAYKVAIQSLIEEENVDALIVVGAAVEVREREIYEVFGSLRSKVMEKPVFLVTLLGDRVVYNRIACSVKTMGLPPPYLSAERAIRAAAYLHHYYKFRNRGA